MADNKSALPELEADYNKYKTNSLKYPENVDDLAHLMLFNINVNEFSRDRKATDTGTARTDVLRGKQGGIPTITRSAINLDKFIGVDIKSSRKTVRTQTSIALYVPDTVVFDDNQSYENFSLTKEFGVFGTLAADVAMGSSNSETRALAGLLGAAAATSTLGALVDAAKERFKKASLGGVSNALGGLGKTAGKVATAGLKLSGFAVNPMMEIIYNNPDLRSFEFNFNFAPKSQNEAKVVGEIIKQFRRHQAPEFNKSFGTNGAVFIPPSDFDISYHVNNGSGFSENTNFPRISTCVLKTVNTNYAPQNFATFEDGSSVNITLRLVFQEMDMITRDRVDMGF